MGRAYKALLLVALWLFLCGPAWGYAVVKEFSFTKLSDGKVSLRLSGKEASVDGGKITVFGAKIEYPGGYSVVASRADFWLGKDRFVFRKSTLSGGKGFVMKSALMKSWRSGIRSSYPVAKIKDRFGRIKVSSKYSHFFRKGGRRHLVFLKDAKLTSSKFDASGNSIEVVLKGNRVSYVRVDGDVFLVVGNKRAFCKTLFWYPKLDKLSLIGDVVVRDEKNSFRGDRLYYSFKTEGFSSGGGEGRIMFHFSGRD